jgi:arylsulfatase
MEETLSSLRDTTQPPGAKAAQSIDRIRAGLNKMIDEQLQSRGIR